jgi:hypothetical protein
MRVDCFETISGGDHPVSNASEPAENAGISNVDQGLVATSSQQGNWKYPLRLFAYPFILVFRFIARLLFVIVLAAMICFFILTVATIVASFAYLLISIFDLIFRTHVHNWIDDKNSSIADWMKQTYSSAIEPILYTLWGQIVNWSEEVGLSAFLDEIKTLLSNLATEVVRTFILFILFISAGIWTYHLRVVHRIKYAALELAVAVVAMWIAIDGMSAGDFSLQYILALDD